MENDLTMRSAPQMQGVADRRDEAGVEVIVSPALTGRNRLTVAFRPILALPHLLLVGGPAGLALTFVWTSGTGPEPRWGVGTGVLGAVAAVCAMIAWFAIVATARHPSGLWSLAASYLRWRVRATAYVALLRDDYPPFGDAPYPASIRLNVPRTPRPRLTVAFRPLLALPHVILVWILGLVWAFVTLVSWVSILLTGKYPAQLYHFGVGALRYTTRVEAYVLLLRDEYPPFSLDTHYAIDRPRPLRGAPHRPLIRSL